MCIRSRNSTGGEDVLSAAPGTPGASDSQYQNLKENPTNISPVIQYAICNSERFTAGQVHIMERVVAFRVLWPLQLHAGVGAKSADMLFRSANPPIFITVNAFLCLTSVSCQRAGIKYDTILRHRAKIKQRMNDDEWLGHNTMQCKTEGRPPRGSAWANQHSQIDFRTLPSCAAQSETHNPLTALRTVYPTPGHPFCTRDTPVLMFPGASTHHADQHNGIWGALLSILRTLGARLA